MDRAPEGYELLEELGRGAMGVVYRARERATQREVALKLIPLDGLDAEARLRFQREAELAAGLRHPGIVTVYAAGLEPARGWIACELIVGARPLHEAWVDLPHPGRVRLVIEAARALGHAHANGVVHRDVKGENVLVGEDGRVRVTDFGLALRAAEERLTRTGALVGTPSAMAPEQVRGERAAIGPWTDVWALGALLYRALTDRAPFEGANLIALLSQVARSSPLPPRRLEPSISPALELECLRALQQDPRARHADAHELALALAHALEAEAVTGRRTGPAAAAVLLGAAALLLVLAAGLGALLLAPPPAPGGGGAAQAGSSRRPAASRSPTPPTSAPEPDPTSPPASRRDPPRLTRFHYDQGAEDLPVHAHWRERSFQAERSGDAAAVEEALRGCMEEIGCVRCAEELAERLLFGALEQFEEGLVILRAAAEVGEPRAAWRYACLAWADGSEPSERVRELARAAATDPWLCTRVDGLNARQLYVEVLLAGVGGPVDLPTALGLLDEPLRAPQRGLLRLQARAWREGLRGTKDPARAAALEQQARVAGGDPLGALRLLSRRATVQRLALEWAPRIRAGGPDPGYEEVQRILTEGDQLEQAHQDQRAEALYRDGLERLGHARLAGRLAALLRRGDAGQQLEALAIYLAGAGGGDPSHMWRYADLARALEAEEPPRLRAWVERAVKEVQPGEGNGAVVLARWLVEGYGGPPEPERARALLDRAIEAGSERALTARRQLFPDPTR